MDKMEAFVESAYEARKAVMAEEAVKREAKRLEKAEKDALQMATFREFVALNVPMELMDAVQWPKVDDIYSGGQVTVHAPGCIPVALIYYVTQNLTYYLPNGQMAWVVPGLFITPPYWDPSEREIFDGQAYYTYNPTAGNDRLYARDCQEAIGFARERHLKLVEADAEHGRIWSELALQHMPERLSGTGELVKMLNLGAEKGNGRIAQDGEHVYVPAPEALTPEEAFGQAFHDYMRYLVGTIMREGQE